MAEGMVWLTQKLISVLFDKGRSTITEHLKNIFGTGELVEAAICRDFRYTAEDGKDYTTRFYYLDAIIAVGFRVNSARAMQFRQSATGVLRLRLSRLRAGQRTPEERRVPKQRVLRTPGGGNPRNPRQRAAVLLENHGHLRDRAGLQRRGGDHADLLRHCAKQAPVRHPWPHGDGADRGARRQSNGAGHGGSERPHES